MKAADSRLNAFWGLWSTHAEEYEILVPKAGIKLMPPAVEVCSPNHCNTENPPRVKVFNQQDILTPSLFWGNRYRNMQKISSINATMVKIKQ